MLELFCATLFLHNKNTIRGILISLDSGGIFFVVQLQPNLLRVPFDTVQEYLFLLKVFAVCVKAAAQGNGLPEASELLGNCLAMGRLWMTYKTGLANVVLREAGSEVRDWEEAWG